MEILKLGSKGSQVRILKGALTELGYPVEDTDLFDEECEAAVYDFQKSNGLLEDGEVGPKTAGRIQHAIDAKNGDLPVSTPVPSGSTPWMDWLKERDGWTEFDHDRQLSAYWPLCGLDYTTVIGASHAWCALTVNASLHDTGFKGNGRADAVSFEKYGSACGWVYGAIVPIRHADGSHHVTYFDHWVDEAGKIAACRGGNQSNAIRLSTYNLSGNVHGHDECHSGPRWPVKS